MMTNMAIDYGKQFINQNIPANYGGMLEKYIPIGQLKVMQRCSLILRLLILIILQYYFAVDNTYVTKKLGLLLFPFAHSDWYVELNNGVM